MALLIANNIESLRAQRQLANTSQSLGKTFERLSSGLRINSPSDDPTGLALADSLRADARVASVAIRNANDGLSLAAIADGGLQEISNILQRMLELAQQSANGVYTQDQRSALASEFVALGSEIERIASTTEFNDFKLLSASGNITFQVGLDGTSGSQITLAGVLGTLSSLSLSGGSGALSFSIIATTSTASQLAAQNALTAVTGALTSVSSRRGTLGAAESRLTTAVNFLTVVRENFIAAESRIRDADIAEEVSNLVRLQVLQQAGVAVLAQANQQPEAVLKLLA